MLLIETFRRTMLRSQCIQSKWIKSWSCGYRLCCIWTNGHHMTVPRNSWLVLISSSDIYIKIKLAGLWSNEETKYHNALRFFSTWKHSFHFVQEMWRNSTINRRELINVATNRFSSSCYSLGITEGKKNFFNFLKF